MCTCNTFCWTRQLFNTTLIGPVGFRGRESWVLVLHSAEPDSYLTLLWMVPWHLEDGSYVYLYYIQLDQTVIQDYFDWCRRIWWTIVMCTCIIFCSTRQLCNTTLTNPVAFGGRELCVLVLYSARPDSYVTLLWLIPWYLVDESYVYLHYILLDQKVI
jgi:hypothetical protein